MGPKKYTQDEFAKALRQIRNGCSISSVSKSTGIPKQTLYDHSKGKYKNKITQMGPDRALTESEEKALVNYSLYMSDRGYPLTRSMIRAFTRAIIKKSGRDTKINMLNGPSHEWIRKFLKRHPELSEKHPDVLDRDRAHVTNKEITEYFNLLDKVLTSKNLHDKPQCIFNCDESGFSAREKFRGKVISRKGKHSYQQVVKFTGHTTVHLAISAAGKVIPPCIIYEKTLPRNCDFAPKEYRLSATQNGYINMKLFFEWFRDIFVPNCGSQRPVLLTMDNHASHFCPDLVDLAIEEGIELLFLPPHATHLLQPLDKGFFHLLKQKMTESALSVGYAGARVVPRDKFASLLYHGINRISPHDIMSAFHKTGMFPLNPTQVSNPIEIAMNISSSGENPLEEDESCQECGGHSVTNRLVKLGIVPADLAHILVEPPLVKPKQKRKRIEGARWITVADLNSSESQSASTSSATAEIHMETNSDCDYVDDGIDCSICKLRDRGFWVGCDNIICERWFHYECLPSSQQTLFDLSLVTKDEWLCEMCQEE
ncbi:uncharacterized protein LOC132737921 [Ruditapes philippinarum]|uniref:uncharacterized protein LOC132737921 n=1 Tax=Ruditapes philippinarum TaxID=129788 RepID=UPI00295BF43F|nr:uncharacterized protein LOC132737921 [Ruditapes philippinarum]